MKRSTGLILIIIAALLMSVVALPTSIKSQFPDAPVLSWVKNQNPVLGLDLQGGTQLDYRIDLSGVEARNNDDDPSNDAVVQDVVRGVQDTIERRVNGLGVSEPNIYTSDVAGEKHIIVELAGIKDVDEAKAIVGKTIQLEFKEPRTEEDPEADAALTERMEEAGQEALDTILEEPGEFDSISENLQNTDGKILFEKSRESFGSSLTGELKEVLADMKVGDIYPELVESSGDFLVDASGQVTERQGFMVVKLEAKEKRDKTTSQEEEVRASHIVIAYEGAEGADEDITRTKERALEKAQEVLTEVQADPDNFAEFAKEYSDGPTGPDGGDLDFFGRGAMIPAFEEVAFAMDLDDISEVVETEFGYHIIKVTDKKEASEETVEEDYYTFSTLLFDSTPEPWQSTGLDGSKFKYASVVYGQIGNPQVSIQFDDEGAKLFEELTGRLEGQQLAIFVGGELISAPTVNEKIVGGQAQITGTYTLEQALQLSNDLNTGAIDAPIVLSGQYTISASLGKDALKLSLYAGIIGLIALAIFMILYYRLMGIFAVLALAIYSVIIIFIINTTGIVMSLAGIAGIILSIGMAVDANILIFERTKEELADGGSYAVSIRVGFERAWSSIRDSNVSSLITCVILWFFGNSIIRGFALMLGIGIIVSMFTAINVTRAFLETLKGTKASDNHFWLGGKKK